MPSPLNAPSIEQYEATIYVSQLALSTIAKLHGLDDVERVLLANRPETDIRNDEGYYLNVNSMRISALPQNSVIGACLSPKDIEKYQSHVSFPPELRGIVYSGAPKLPDAYQQILQYWSRLEISPEHMEAHHCQNLLNEYDVQLEAIDGRSPDVLLSNGVVACVHGLSLLLAGLSPEQYVEIHFPIDSDMLGEEREKFDSAADYSVSTNQHCERLFIRVNDVLRSPNPDFLAIAALHTEWWDMDFAM